MTPDDSDTTNILGVPVSVCEQCDRPFANKSGEREYCNECFNENVIPREALEALAEDWEETATEAREQEQTFSALWNSRHADKLWEILEEHE